MTINYARENVIDFTKPFMNLGIGILFKVSSTEPFIIPTEAEKAGEAGFGGCATREKRVSTRCK